MSLILDRPTLQLPNIPVPEALELACRANLGVWAERKRHFTNAPLHWEWYELVQTIGRLCVVAPRDHAKSECVTVNQCTWRCTYTPGFWCYVFAQTGDQAKALLARIKTAMWETAPWMMEGKHSENMNDVVFANWSRVTVAGAGKSVRGAHPDLIVGDDVLEEGNSLTYLQRKRIERWWLGTISGMSHPGTYRSLGNDEFATQVWLEPTRVHLVGTPFHAQDLLMSLKDNPIYRWRRYAAEYEAHDLKVGLAVEAA